MIQDTPDGQTHSENDGCGIKEHNMTLREKLSEDWNKFNGDQVGDETTLDWFISRFDAMLAEDIGVLLEIIDTLPKHRHRSAYENGVWVALVGAKAVLEDRRLTLKNKS